MLASRQDNRRLVQIFVLIFGLIACGFIWWFSSSPLLDQLSAYVTSQLDKMNATVLKLTAVSSLGSTALTLLPGDTATPLAENLADIADYLILVIAGIWLQKFMFSSLGLLALKFLIPLGIIFNLVPIAFDLLGYEVALEKKWRALGLKVALFGSVLFALVPSTIYVTQALEGTYQARLDQTLENAEALDLSLTAENQVQEQATTPAQDQNLLGQIGSAISGVVDGVVQFTSDAVELVGTSVTELPQKLIGLLNDMIEALAILLVVNCLAPILVFFFLMWLTRMIFGKDFSQSTLLNLKPMGTWVRKRHNTNNV